MQAYDSYKLDYYPFGSTMPGRTFTSQNYRFGFQGQEQENDISSVDGGHLAFKFRIHDARIGRFFSIDPIAASFPWNSPYAFSENSTIAFIELEGKEKIGFMSQWIHVDNDPMLETSGKVIGNIFVNLINIVPAVWNTGVTLVTEGPAQNIADFNNSLDVLSMKIAEDMIEAKVCDNVETGLDYVIEKSQEPDVVEEVLTGLILYGGFKAYGAASAEASELGNISKMSVAEGLSDFAKSPGSIVAPTTLAPNGYLTTGAGTLAQLQGKFNSLAKSSLLPQYLSADPFLTYGYTGSFKTGVVGNASKPTYGQPINLKSFDIDFWIKSDILYKANGPGLKANVNFRRHLSKTPGFEGLKPNKKGFSIKFKPKTRF